LEEKIKKNIDSKAKAVRRSLGVGWTKQVKLHIAQPA